MLKRAVVRLIARVVAVGVILWLLAHPLRPHLIALAQSLASDWRTYIVVFIGSGIAYGITRRGRLRPTDPARLSTAERVPIDEQHKTWGGSWI